MKRLLTLTLCLMLALSLGACGSSGKTPPKEVNVPQLADDLLAALEPLGETMELTGDLAQNYYRLDGLVSEYKIYISTMYIAEEVAVLRLTDAGKTKEGKALVEARLADIRASFHNYLPEEFKTANENALVLQQGDIVCLLLGYQPGLDAAKKVFDQATA